MVKKILFILFISISFIGFSQKKSLDNLTAAPNPFTNSTKISFIADVNSSIIFVVKNVLGKTVFNKNIKTKEGNNSFYFFKNNLASGMYIYSITNNKKIISKRFVIK
jgi:hypothetical protein